MALLPTGTATVCRVALGLTEMGMPVAIGAAAEGENATVPASS